MSDIKLSYVLTTFNKFPYLQEVLTQLMSNKKSDEEIIVTDGKSTDGTVGWLKQLFSEGRIDVLISEKDIGEAHGFNKAMMLARGELIKIITADDVFYYPAIHACREFMLNNPAMDILTSVIPNVDMRQKGNISYDQDTISNFERCKKKEVSFFYFNCIPLMIRRSQLPKLGLLHTSFTMVDYEYSMRVSKVANIALYTNPLALRIMNDTSNFITMNDKKKSDEYLKTDFMYDKIRLKYVSDYSYSELTGAMLTKFRHLVAFRTRIKKIFGMNKSQTTSIPPDEVPSTIPEAYSYFYRWLERENNIRDGEFILP